MSEQRGRGDRPRFRGLVWRLALVLGSLVGMALVAEAIARIVLPPQQIVEVEPATVRRSSPGHTEEREQERGIDVVIDWSGHHGIRLNPGVRATIRNHNLSHRDIVIETNSLGLRHPELGVKADDEYRVLVLGDSITFCDYISFEEAVTHQLEDRLGGRVPRVVVINAGLPGASASDELYHYLEIRDAVDPDLVLVGMYLNDAQSSGFFYARSLPEPFASSRFLSWFVNRVEALRLRLWTDESLPEIDPEWAERFRDGRDLQSGDMWQSQDAFDFEIYNARDDFGLAWNPQSWVIVERITRTTVLAARERGQTIAAFLFPLHIQVKGSVDDFQPQESFRRMCRSLDLPCLDLVPALRQDWGRSGTELFFDHCHLTPYGNGVVAAALAEWLDEERLVPTPE
jgi:lysophospholipase L1-like esterase